MAVSLSIALKQSQRLAMTQSLRQSIEMLQYSALELSETIANEILQNPVLEEEVPASLPDFTADNDGLVNDINLQLSGDNSKPERMEQRALDYADVSDTGYFKSGDEDKKQQAIENAFVQRESLADHLIEQIRELKAPEYELELLTIVATLLDENGFFTSEHREFCNENGITDNKLESLLETVSTLDPVGCGAGSVKESLSIQARTLYPEDETLIIIIEEYFDELSRLFYDRIAKKMDLSVETIIRKSALLQSLSPYPGRIYSKMATSYVIPELEVQYIDGEIVLFFYDEWVPKIKINSYYSQMVQQQKVDKEIKKYIREKINSAKYLMRSISGRRETIEKVVFAIMEHQVGFLKNGPGYLKPLVHADIAEQTGFNESTISRVTSNKYIQTAWGIFELKHFFVSKIISEDAEHSSDNVMKLIQDIIEKEDPEKPYTDEEIVARLSKAGINAARRTIAKYRGVLDIPASSKRKRINKLKME